MDWIKADEEIFHHVGQRISKGDTALYGRVTYQMMENYWPGAGKNPGATPHEIEHARWYSTVHKVVLSRTLKDVALPNTSIISDCLAESIREIKQERGEEGKEILLFGSPSATHALMSLNLIDGYWLFLNPILLGHGIPLFSGIKEKTKLNLIGTRTFNSGVTELSYINA